VRNSIAIILARGGSKRLPRKNIIDFCGKPMLAWTIQAAIYSNCFSRVLVSTDDMEIAEIGKTYGAEVPFLRETGADDLSASSDATLGALFQAEAYWGETYSVVSQLMANCPLRSSHEIVEAFSHFDQHNIVSQISCFRYGWMNPWWAAKLSKSGEPRYLFPDTNKVRSQDLEPLFCPTGALWISKRDELLKSKNFYMPGHVFFPMNWMNALDIDDEEDLQMAKACFTLIK